MKMTKHDFKKVWKSKSFVTLFIFGLCFAGLSAIWLMDFTATTGYVITSESQITFTDDFSIGAVDVTNNSVSKIETIDILNMDGAFNMTVGIDTTTDDVSDGCDNSGDVNISSEYDGSAIYDGANITIDTGLSEFVVRTDVAQLSCPQNVTTEISLNPI